MSKKKTSGKYAAKKKKSGRGLIIAIVIVAILLVALSAILLLDRSDETESTSAVSTETVNNTAGEAAAAQTVATIPAETSVSLGHGLYITDIGSYTGVYMEDGTDEILSGILMMVVKNDGEQDIQYAAADKCIHRPCTVTFTAQDRSAEVVEHDEGHTQKIDA